MNDRIDRKIGYIQGRLCDLVDGKIQAFPWDDWKSEFPLAKQLGVTLMEWTLDQDRLYENPLMTKAGQANIRSLMLRHSINIDSLTGDCFMQAPFWKAEGEARNTLIDDFRNIISACAALGIRYIVVPLVDNGSIEGDIQKHSLFDGLREISGQLSNNCIKVVFESDYDADRLAEFIGDLDESLFGINYDIGNSAALGYDPVKEIRAYCDRIWNVHVKDRVLGGTTVPLGQGNADFKTVFRELTNCDYQGNYILQTARAEDNRHEKALAKYRDMVRSWICETAV